MIDRSQWGFVAMLIGLCLGIAVLHIHDRWPASSYSAAMAAGQYDKAGDFLKQQVAQNNPQAQNAMANLYYLGLGQAIDYERAASLYHLAASQGYGAAQLNLGHLYQQGLGVRKSIERAFAWYNQANIADNEWAEYYMTQISGELSLTPLQMSAVKTRWLKLPVLAAEPL